MEPFESNFQEFRVLKQRARSVGVPITTLFRFKDRAFRHHLITLHGNGSPLSELADYVAAFYSVEVTPQQLRKILQRSDREAWSAVVSSYQQHRLASKLERLPATKGI